MDDFKVEVYIVTLESGSAVFEAGSLPMLTSGAVQLRPSHQRGERHRLVIAMHKIGLVSALADRQAGGC